MINNSNSNIRYIINIRIMNIMRMARKMAVYIHTHLLLHNQEGLSSSQIKRKPPYLSVIFFTSLIFSDDRK